MPSYHQLPIVELSIHCLETHYVVQHTPANKRKPTPMCIHVRTRDVLTLISFVPIIVLLRPNPYFRYTVNVFFMVCEMILYAHVYTVLAPGLES